jgi:pyruvate/2-oxoglutarate dehydrogenase complex dihydrolipoamide dehydrogenase (E3) component
VSATSVGAKAFDAIVIGSGQGGNPLAHGLADRGFAVALVEREHLGGTCINTGCTPTKTMVASAQIAHYARHARRWGVRTGAVTVDLRAVVKRKDAIVRQFRAGQEKKVESRRPRLTLYRSHARFTGPRTVDVGDAVLEAARIFVDTGTRPVVPDIPGIDTTEYLTNATVMELTEVPRHLLVLGGGYIGLEFGQMFRRFGSRVTLVHRGAEILPREDADVASEARTALEAEGIAFVLDARTTGAARARDGVRLTVEAAGGRRTLSGSHLLVATGRRPNTDDLGLDRAGVETDRQGYIRVNSRLETNVPGIWALGDVKGGPAFTHVSYHDYQIIFANVIDGAGTTIEGRLVPYALFTDPQLGRVGMTETEARTAGYRLKIGRIPMTSVARAIERSETAGSMKLVVDAATDRILGAAILATEGGELVQMLRVAMRAGLPYTALKGDIYIHPTLAEGFWSLMEAVAPVA